MCPCLAPRDIIRHLPDPRAKRCGRTPKGIVIRSRGNAGELDVLVGTPFVTTLYRYQTQVQSGKCKVESKFKVKVRRIAVPCDARVGGRSSETAPVRVGATPESTPIWLLLLLLCSGVRVPRARASRAFQCGAPASRA